MADQQQEQVELPPEQMSASEIALAKEEQFKKK